jgi:hypothetical protein
LNERSGGDGSFVGGPGGGLRGCRLPEAGGDGRDKDGRYKEGRKGSAPPEDEGAPQGRWDTALARAFSFGNLQKSPAEKALGRPRPEGQSGTCRSPP